MIDYDTAFTNTDGNPFPATKSVNASGPSATDGTEFVKVMVDDEWGARQALMDVAGLTPNAVPEAAAVDLTKPSGRKSQMLDAMFKLFERRAICIDAGAGTADAIQVDAIAALFEFYQDGLVILFNPFEPNTGAATINIDGLGAKDIVSPGGTALGGGEFQHDHFATLVFDLANDRFEYINQVDSPNRVRTETGAFSTGTTIMPQDDSIPQNTEGDEYMSIAITPKKATNKLKVVAIVNGSPSVTTGVAALFKDSDADAVAAGMYNDDANGIPGQVVLNYEIVAGSTSPITFKVRAGVGTSGTFTFNGDAGARKLGGVLLSSITVEEIPV